MPHTPALRRCGGALAVTGLLLAVPGMAAGAAAPKLEPVPASHFRAVEVDIAFVDAQGSVVERRSCAWTAEPGAEDRPCLRFQSDPWPAIEAIAAAGAERAVSRTTVPSRGEQLTLAVSRRADGTWLLRTTGAGHHFGRVCDVATRECARWDAEGARRAAPDIRAAASTLGGSA